MQYGFLSLLWLIALPSLLVAQATPVTWRAKVERINANTYDLVFEANIAEGWALYAASLDSEEGPIPVTIMLQQYQGYQRLGDLYEYPDNRTESWDAIFEQTLAKYRTNARFKQRIRAETPIVIYVPIEYMSCSNRSCLPARYVELALDLRQVDTWITPYRAWE